MAFIPATDGIKVELKFNKDGALVVNIIWFKVSVTIDTTLLQDIATTIVGWWDDNMKAVTTNDMALFEVIATDMSEEDGLQWVEGLVTPIVGTVSTGDLPSNVAAVVSFLSDHAGRSFRGRNYVAGVPASLVTGNTLGSTYVAALLTAYADMNDQLLLKDATHVVASFQADNAPRTAGLLTPITGYRMDNVVDTQRRRIPRVFT